MISLFSKLIAMTLESVSSDLIVIETKAAMGMRLAYSVAVVACLACALTGGADLARAQGTTGRVDVPISQRVLPNGDTRYSVPVSIGGGTPIDASLDTGSFGVRVLARALNPSQYEATTMERRYGFGGGARFNGVLAKGEITVGDASSGAPVTFQLIQSVDCTPQKPHCPASRVNATDYRIAGDGYPGVGFDAIIGVSLRKAQGGAGADNPLSKIGDQRWIIILPRPGEPSSGHLIINPSQDEASGFTMFHLSPQRSNGEADGDRPGWKDMALSGCVVNEQSSERICGQSYFDSGAPGVTINSTHVSSPTAWAEGTAVKLQLQGGDRPVEMPFSVGPDISTKVRIVPGQSGEERLSFGSLPYFYYAILYDQKNGLIGLKPRDDR